MPKAESSPCYDKSHGYIKESNGVKSMKGAASLAYKGIKEGTSMKVDKHGVGGTWKKG